MKNICIVAPTVEYLDYTIARAIASDEISVYVLTSPKEAASSRGHSFYYDRIKGSDNVCIIHDPKPILWDWTYFQLTPKLCQFSLKDLLTSTQNVGLISGCSKVPYLTTLWRELKETIKYFPIISKSKRVFFLEGYHNLDLYSLVASKHLIGFDVHSNFLVDEGLNNRMFSFDWSPQAHRTYKLNFIGNRNPTERTQVLEYIKPSLSQWKQRADQTLTNENLLWIEYGDDPGELRGVPAQTFIHYLEESDFTLCPPGYSKLTHRVIEALVKGSIPILHEDELELYDINLEHGINCIAVKQGDWSKAISLALSLDYKRICDMRVKILSMRDEFLSEQAFSAKLRKKMISD